MTNSYYNYNYCSDYNKQTQRNNNFNSLFIYPLPTLFKDCILWRQANVKVNDLTSNVKRC